tara:strand:+ start:355 stop:555 length:201 start_codon:yes stop_codon:yes gene_type:complete
MQNLKNNELEFLKEIAIQLTENTFGEDTFTNYRAKGKIKLQEQAKNFYNESYKEIKSLYINLIKNK